MAAKPIYRVVVHQQGEIWDLYTFEGVKRSYLPLNAIVRIDEVEREGPLKAVKSDARVAEFPRPFPLPPRGEG